MRELATTTSKSVDENPNLAFRYLLQSSRGYPKEKRKKIVLAVIFGTIVAVLIGLSIYFLTTASSSSSTSSSSSFFSASSSDPGSSSPPIWALTSDNRSNIININKGNSSSNSINNNNNINKPWLLVLIGGMNSKSEVVSTIEVLGKDGPVNCSAIPKTLFQPPKYHYHVSGITTTSNTLETLLASCTLHKSTQKLQSCYRFIKDHWEETPAAGTKKDLLSKFLTKTTNKKKSGEKTSSLSSSGFILNQTLAFRTPEGSLSGFEIDKDRIIEFKSKEALEIPEGSCFVTMDDERSVMVTGGMMTKEDDEVLTGGVFVLEVRGDGKIGKGAMRYPDMNLPRRLHGCSKFGDSFSTFVIVAGGITSNGIATNSVEVLQISGGGITTTNKKNSYIWRTANPLNHARSHSPSIGILGGQIIVAGGIVSTSSKYPSNNNASKSVEYFDESKQVWRMSNKLALREERFYHSTALVEEDFCRPESSSSVLTKMVLLPNVNKDDKYSRVV